MSYAWAGTYGLLAEIMGAAIYAVDHPNLPAYVVPVQPTKLPVLPQVPTTAQIRQLTDKNILLK